jgi:glycosyltransferase involved in cell wall biosynthesis
VLEPDRDAGSRSTMEHIRALLRAGWVVKFRPDNGLATPVYTQALQAMGIEVLHAPFVADFAAWMEANGDAIDHVLLNRPQVAHDLLPIIRRLSTARVVFYGHDLHFARMQRAAALGGDPKGGEQLGDAGASAAAERMLATERAVWQDCDTVLYPSEEEAAEVRRLEPLVHVQAVTPYCFEEFPRRAAVAPASGGLLFVAGFAHPPNVDAARWLVQDVLPLIRQRLPGVRLTLAGSNPTVEVRALAAEGVIVTGSLSAEALAGHYAAARVAVVPLRFGAGVKLKVVEALQQGLPLVTTPIGAQGLPGLPAILPVAADPAALAAEILRLFRDDAAWLRQSAAQSAYAERHFSKAVLQESILSAFVPAASETLWAA